MGIAGADITCVDTRERLVWTENRQHSRLRSGLNLNPRISDPEQSPIPVPVNGEWGWGVCECALNSEGGSREDNGGGGDGEQGHSRGI